jgi:hypothetical protein
VRRAALPLALLAVAFALVPVAGGAEEERSACQRLKAAHDLAPAKGVKLVRRRWLGGWELVGCVMPRGRVRVVADTNGGYESGFTARQVAGHHVLVGTYESTSVFTAYRTYVFDLKRGQEYTVTSRNDSDDHNCAARKAVSAFVNSAGQAAAMLHGPCWDARVAGFTSTGRRALLDSGPKAQIPASSLSLDRHLVRWTHSGTRRSATLSG